ncbi:MAG: DMT family transporter [Paracoccaceae bacterium]
MPSVPASETASRAAVKSPAAGILWMVLSCALLSGVAICGRYAALEGVAVLQIVFLRLVFAAVAMAPMAAVRGLEMVRTRHWRIYLVRVAAGSLAMTTWFAAVALSPVGEVTAIGFLMPLFATLGAALFLGERVRWRRWAAVGIGFCGMLVILRPGLVPASPGTWLAVVSAMAMAVSSLFIKRLADRDDPDKVVLITTLMMTAVALGPGLWVWQPLTLELWAVFALMGALGMLGHITLARALRAADASIVMGADFARLPFAVLFGWLLFGELIDLWTWIGAALIFAAAFYAARREREVRPRSSVGSTSDVP